MSTRTMLSVRGKAVALAITGMFALGANVASAAGTWSENVYTQTIDGISYIINTCDDGRVTIGTNLTKDTPAGTLPADGFRGTVGDVDGVLALPEEFIVDGTRYPSLPVQDSHGMVIGNRAFAGYANLRSVIFPSSFYMFISYSFKDCASLESVWFKGLPSVSSGTQAYMLLRGMGTGVAVATTTFRGCPKLKCVLVGPNIKGNGANRLGFPEQVGCIFFVPRNPANATWDSTNYGTDSHVVFYGPDAADLDIDGADGMGNGTITFTPRTAHALTNVLAAASTIHRDFGLDVKVNVTNEIDVAEGTISRDMMSDVSFESLTFTVKTQRQLNMVLSAVPDSIPLGLVIDPASATEELVLPSTRKVWVRFAGEGKIRPYIKGFILTVR